MKEVCKVVLSMSLSGSIVAVALLLLQKLFGKKLGRQWQYYLWLIAVLRFLIPFAPPHNLAGALFQKAEAAAASAAVAGADLKEGKEASGSTGIGARLEGEAQQVPEGKPEGEAQQAPGGRPGPVAAETAGQTALSEKAGGGWQAAVWKYACLAWLVPALFLLVRKVTAYRDFLAYIRAGSTEVQDIAMLERFGRLVGQCRVRGAVELSVNHMAASPMLVGFLRPCIILPSAEISDADFEYAVLHELTHYKRLDLLYKWLVQAVACIHWFNPFAYVLMGCTGRACELSCDEAVIRRLDTQGRYAYGDMLLRAAGNIGGYKDPVSSVTLSEDKKQIKERLDAIMTFHKKSKAAVLLSAGLTAAVALGASYAGAYAVDARGAEGGREASAAPVRSDREEYTVVYKNGEYFILFDGAKKGDMPSSTGPDYGVTFCAVWKDGSASFDSYHVNGRLAKKVKKDCVYFKEKGVMTEDETKAVVAVAKKVQEGDAASYLSDGQQAEYEAWGIKKSGGAYYYGGKRVRILMEIRKDKSFENFNYDKGGEVDLKVVRNGRHKIKKVVYLSAKKAQKIINDLEGTEASGGGTLSIDEITVVRLKKEEAPAAVQSQLRSCEPGKWHMISGGGRRYVYYDGLEDDYAFEMESGDGQPMSLDVYDFGKSHAGYVLLSVQQGEPLEVRYNHVPVLSDKG